MRALLNRVKQLESKINSQDVLVVEAEYIELIEGKPLTQKEFEDTYLTHYKKKPKIEWIEK